MCYKFYIEIEYLIAIANENCYNQKKKQKVSVIHSLIKYQQQQKYLKLI